MALGIDHDVEHEGVDVKNTTLPGLQEEFAKQVLAKGKPTVLVIVPTLQPPPAPPIPPPPSATHGQQACSHCTMMTMHVDDIDSGNKK